VLFVYLAAAVLHAVLIEPGEAPIPYTFDLGRTHNELGFRAQVDAVHHLGMCDGHVLLANAEDVHYYNLYGLIRACRAEGPRAPGGGRGTNAADATAETARRYRDLLAPAGEDD
jgi:hypothetical protein